VGCVCTVNAKGRAIYGGSANVRCVCTVNAAAGLVTGSANVRCVCTVVPTASVIHRASATLDCVSTVNASASAIHHAIAAVACVATVNASGTKAVIGAANVRCVCTVHASAEVVIFPTSSSILIAIRDKLVSDGVFGFPCCYIVAGPALALPPCDHIAQIAPGPNNVRQITVDGAGNEVLWLDGSARITLWNRLALDQTTHCDDALTDSVLGLTRYLTCTVNSLSQYFPTDPNGNPLVTEPIRFVQMDFGKSKDQAGWTNADMVFEFSYRYQFPV
jgi:hypothetical protein